MALSVADGLVHHSVVYVAAFELAPLWAPLPGTTRYPWPGVVLHDVVDGHYHLDRRVIHGPALSSMAPSVESSATDGLIHHSVVCAAAVHLAP